MFEQHSPHAVQRLSAYLDTFFVIWPVLLVGMFSGFAIKLTYICKEQTLGAKIAMLFVTIFPSGVASCIGVLLLPLLAKDVEPGVEIGIAGILGGLGAKGFDLMVRKVLKLTLTDSRFVHEGSNNNKGV